MSLDEFLKRPTPEITLPEDLSTDSLWSQFSQIKEGKKVPRICVNLRNLRTNPFFPENVDGWVDNPDLLSQFLSLGFTPERKDASKTVSLPVPVLAAPLQASDVEPGNTTHTRSGEARESNKAITPLPLSQGCNEALDSRGGQTLFTTPRKPRRCRYCGQFDFETPLVFRRGFQGLSNYVCRDNTACSRRMKKRPGPHFV